MSVQHPALYKDVPAWQLSDSFWLRIKPLLPKPKSRLRGRGNKRRNVGGRLPQGATVGSGSSTLLAESVSEIIGEVGEEEGKLSVNASLCLRDYLLEEMRGLEIGSKMLST